MMPYMKQSIKHLAFWSIAVCMIISACAGLREKKAEHHQPFGPHKNKKPHHAHPQH
jgi:hypothetical protein